MPSPTKPNVLPVWTQGNTGARTQPTTGEQFAGFVQNQRPDPTWHNWLWGIMSDWIEWFDYIVDNPENFPVSNAGHNVATSTNLQGQLDELDAVYSTIGLYVAALTADVADSSGATFLLPQAPVNSQSVQPMVDGLASNPAEYTIAQVSGQWAVIFGASYIPAAGEKVSALFMTGSSGVGVGGGVGGLANVAGGVGIYYQNQVNIAYLKSLIAGTNVTISDDGHGHLTIAATGGGGGGVETHGEAASPISIDPTVGIAPTSAAEQVWWITPLSGSGAIPITATPPISAGVSVGQKLRLKSVAASGSTGWLVIPNTVPTQGTDQNGNCSMGNFAQTIDYTWDGTNWSEDSRRV